MARVGLVMLMMVSLRQSCRAPSRYAALRPRPQQTR